MHQGPVSACGDGALDQLGRFLNYAEKYARRAVGNRAPLLPFLYGANAEPEAFGEFGLRKSKLPPDRSDIGETRRDHATPVPADRHIRRGIGV